MIYTLFIFKWRFSRIATYLNRLLTYWTKRWMVMLMLSMGVLHAAAQHDVNTWLMDRLEAVRDWRQVDYEAMMDTALLNKDVDALIKCLVVIEYNKSIGADSTALVCVDYVLEEGTNNRIKGVVNYLLQTKYTMMISQNRFDEIEKMACYIDRRWPDNPELKKKSEHWHRLAEAGKNIQPVRINRRKNVTTLELYRQEKYRHFINIHADVNQTKNGRFIVDTGVMSSMILYRHAANEMGVKMLPDSVISCSGSAPDVEFSMQMGVLDSLQIGDITLYNLPVWVSDEEVRYDADGFIGTPDLLRLEYMELSSDSITFRYPVPTKTDDVNFRMNAGDRGSHCIISYCMLDAHPFSFLFDTGGDGVILPSQYASNPDEVYAKIGDQTFCFKHSNSHAFTPYSDSIGILGAPLLGAFKKLCINFRNSHIDYIKKEGVDVMELQLKNK